MIHPQERALQRYNKELRFIDLKNITELIRLNQHMIVGLAPKGKGRIFCYVTYNNIPYKVLYERQETQIKVITIYPFDVDEYNELLEKQKEGGMLDYLIQQFMKIFEEEQ